MRFPKIFGRNETKQSTTGAAMVFTPGQPVWSNRNYASFADEGYRRNVVAYQAINKIADAVASVTWLAFKGKQELETHPVLDLIRKPNPMQSGAEYLRAKVGFFLISGNGYEERVKGVRGTVAELYQLRPDRMQIIPGSAGFPVAYQYKNAGRTIRWDVDPAKMDCDVRHMKAFNPLDDWYGMSPLEAGAYAIDQNNQAMSWMQSLLQNSARPSGALVSDSKTPITDDQYSRLKSQLEDQYSGAANAGRPMLLEGGLDWKQMGLSPMDMGIIETKHSSARDIALALGVPPQLIGIPGDNTYSNYQEARLAFWEDTVIPLLSLITDDWNSWLAEPLGVQLRPDLDAVPAIADKRKVLWDMANASEDLTLDDRRAMKGYPPIKGGDQILVPSSMISLAEATAPIADAPDAPADLTTEDIKAWVYGSKAD